MARFHERLPASRRPRQGGFTLVEVLMVMVVAVIGLLGLFATQMVSVRGHMRSRSISEAVILAQDKLEDLGAQPIELVTRGTGGVESQLDPSARSGSGPYTRTTTIIDAQNGGALIHVAVSWTGEGGEARSITLHTMRTP